MKKLILLLFFLSVEILFSQYTERDLSDENWIFAEQGKTNFAKAKVPGTVHTDLQASGQIPDPFFSDNEQRLQWIEKRDWVYKTEFSLSERELANENLRLEFQGLDAYAEVFLNDRKILSADNMFRSWEVDAKPFLKKKKSVGHSLSFRFIGRQAIGKGVPLYVARK